MAAKKVKLALEQGATFRKVFTWKVGDPPLPVNLTPYTARMHIRDEVYSPVVLLSLTTENGGITLGADGTIALYIPASITATIKWESATYDLEIIMPASPEPDVKRFLYGPISVSLEVTRE